MISCCTLCVHFPDGLSSLLPDLVRAVLHSQLICVRSRTAVAPLHPFIHITQIRVEFVTSAVLCSVSSRSELWACLEGDSLACAHFWRRMLFFSFKPPFLSVCHVAVLLPIPPPPSPLISPLQQVLWPLSPCTKRDHRPGDDISEIMSCFTRTPPPSLRSAEERYDEGLLQMPSHHLSLTIESWQGEPFYAAINCHHHLETKTYRL